ncbi:MAG: response regulator [Candidatus Marinimicrobia bacterium]|nr:response regulator [Candidatus Neomarinimicrobiota bacterium]
MFVILKDTESNIFNILVVDDEPSYRKVMKRLLNTDGHNVTLAEDGIDGLRILQKKEFDMVLTDINMPNMNGWEFLEKLNSLYPDLPVAIITGYLEYMDSTKYKIDISTRKILRKPIKLKDIRELIKEL